MTSQIKRTVEKYYNEKIAQHGRTAQGVDWRDEESQLLRFEQVLKVIDRSRPYSLVDYGCGYGALAELLVASNDDFSYVGFDLSAAMLSHAQQVLDDPRIVFQHDRHTVPGADYAVASGVLNVKLDTPIADWSGYALEVIRDLDALARRGFAFNLLTSYSDPERKRADLYYGDPCFYFDHCKVNYSSNVALLHDYGLYEFTILVRK